MVFKVYPPLEENPWNNFKVEYLIENLGKCKNPYTCPHGRPTIVKFTKYEIEKWFKRVV